MTWPPGVMSLPRAVIMRLALEVNIGLRSAWLGDARASVSLSSIRCIVVARGLLLAVPQTLLVADSSQSWREEAYAGMITKCLPVQSTRATGLFGSAINVPMI